MMNTFAINEARKPPRIGSIATISAALLGLAVSAVPALSADLPLYEYNTYRPHYSSYYRDYYRPQHNGCYRCSCCGVRQYGPVVERVPVPIVERRAVVERFPVSERHWVQRDYIERRWPVVRRHYRYRYSYYYPGAASDPYTYYYRPPVRRSPVEYSGVYPPAPISYDYDAGQPSRYAESSQPYQFNPVYEYEPSPQPSYDYEASPRPPAPVPSGYTDDAE